MKEEYNTTQAFVGAYSLTLLLQRRIAEELGIRNGDYLKCYIDGNHLIVEKKHTSSVTRQTAVTEGDY